MFSKVTHNELIAYVQKKGWVERELKRKNTRHFETKNQDKRFAFTIGCSVGFSDYEWLVLWAIDEIAKAENCSMFAVYCKIKDTQIPILFTPENVEQILNYLGTKRIFR